MSTYTDKFNHTSVYSLRLDITPQTHNSDDINNNRTRISWKLYIYKNNNYYSFTTNPVEWSCTINGTVVTSGSGRKSMSASATSLTLGSGTINVPHNSDGTKTVSFSASCTAGNSAYGQYYPGSASLSNSLALTTIPRAATFVSFTGSSVDGTFTFTFNAKATFNYTLVVLNSVGTTIYSSGPISYAAGNRSFTWTFNDSQRNTIYNSYPNSTSATLIAYVQTHNGNSFIGATDNQTIYPAIPASIKPSTPSISVSPINTGNIASWPVYVEGYTKAQVSVSASPGTGASMSSYSITVDGVSISNGGQAGPFSSGTKSVSATATDSRGRATSNATSFTVQPYSRPSISISAQRCTSGGVPSPSGTYLLITPTFSYSTVTGYNSISRSISCNGVSNTTFSSGESFILAANLNVAQTYVVTATISDSVGNSSTVTVNIATDERLLNIKHNKKGIAFGGFSTKDNLVKSYWDIELKSGNICLDYDVISTF